MIHQKKSSLLFAAILICGALITSNIRTEESDEQVQKTLNKKLNTKKPAHNKKLISFKYDSVDLVDIINQLAAEKMVNVILPMGAQEIKTKVTINVEDKLTLDQAWNLLYTLLDVAGYSLIPKYDSYVVVKNSINIAREALPIYLNTPIEQLPDTEKRIVYLYYFTNMQVPKAGTEGTNEIDAIIKEILPTSAVWKYDQLSNGIIMVDQANNIKGAITLMKELDKVGYQEIPEIIRLRYVQADVVADLFAKDILKQQQNRSIQPAGRKSNDALYFSPNVRIIADPRTNSLLAIGKRQALDRVKEFIFNYIDVKLDTGKSILHTYQLQYLEAVPFAVVLNNIISSASTGGTGQSKPGEAPQGGVERFFENVIVTTDTPTTIKQGAPGEYYGGNKLIVAARNDDWERIRKLIEQLDSPQPTVIIEVLIADLTITDDRILGSLMRNSAAIPFPTIGNSIQNLNFQSAQIPTQNGITPGVVTLPVTLPSALPVALSTIAPDIQGPLQQNLAGSISSAAPGSTIISLNEQSDSATGNPGGTYALIQILQGYGSTKILSHPHVIGTHNKKITVSIGEIRLVPAEAVGAAGGTTTAKFKEIKASLTVEITPRISNANTVNLTVAVKIDEFSFAAALSNPFTNGNRVTRTIDTNATIHSGDILALGGLIKTTNVTGVNKVPILGDIPLLGWLFKRQSGSIVKNNLTAFIRPTIIQPRLRGGVGEYTKDYIKLSQEYIHESAMFDSLRDPITRWFFRTEGDANDDIDRFLKQNPDSSIVAENAFAPTRNGRVVVEQPVVIPNPTPGAPAVITHEVPLAPSPVDVIKDDVLKAEEKLAANDTRALVLQKLIGDQENPLLAHQKIGSEAVLNT